MNERRERYLRDGNAIYIKETNSLVLAECLIVWKVSLMNVDYAGY